MIHFILPQILSGGTGLQGRWGADSPPCDAAPMQTGGVYA